MDYDTALNIIDDLYTFGHGWREINDKEQRYSQREALSMAIDAIKMVQNSLGTVVI